VVECIVWGKKNNVYFGSSLGLNWRVRKSSELFDFGNLRLLLKLPFPPLGIIIPTALPPIAFSQDGMTTYISENDPFTYERKVKHYSYKEINTVETRDRDILVNNQLFCRVQSRSSAIKFGNFISKLKGGRVSDREQLIDEQIEDMFRLSEISAKITKFRERTSLLFALCNSLWLCLMLGIPILLLMYGFSRTIIPILGLVILLHITITSTIFLEYAKIYCRRNYSFLYSLLPSPFSSIRAMDLLSKDLLSGYHPFAIARSLLTKERFLEYAKKSLAIIHYPLCDISESEESFKIDKWYKNRLASFMENEIGAMGIDLGSFLIPEINEKGAFPLSYCPRCLSVYDKGDGVCEDCAGLKLIRMPTCRNDSQI
jgi:hypothetical protein